MHREFLTDLDELVLRCQSVAAREAIAEAVACYRVGAFRSCVVSTWNAVVWDYLAKLENLKLQGEKSAIVELDSWRNSVGSLEKKDINTLLDFEKQLLEQACQKFEFISEFERVELERLRDDRNKCAHPSFSRSEEIYQPNAELARVHMIHAVEYLLQNPPTQGQKALKSLLEKIISPYFPTSIKEAKESLRNSTLSHPRKSFLRNFVLVLMKCLLVEDHDKDKRQRWLAALGATFEIHRESVLAIWKEKLPELLKEVPEEHLSRGIQFLLIVPDSWEYWPSERRNHWKRYIENLPAEEVISILSYCLQIPQFQEVTRSKILSLNEESINVMLYAADQVGLSHVPTEVVDRALDLWKKSTNYETANRLARNTLPICIPLLTMEMIQGLLVAVKSNSQLRGSTSIEPFLLKIRNRENGDVKEFDGIARGADLNEMVDRWNGLKSEEQEDFDEEFVDKL